MVNFGSIFEHGGKMTATDWAVDVVAAAGAFGFGCLQLVLAVNLLIPDETLRRMLGIEAVVPTAFALIALAATVAPVVVRRTAPWASFSLSTLFWCVFQSQMGAVSLPLMGPLVALFTLAFERERNETLVAGGLALIALAFTPAVSSSWTLTSLTFMQNAAFLAVAAFAGYALRVRQEYVKAAEARAVEAERTRESEAQRRVEEERVRIAREVHDITAHSLSAVSIQAAVAERLVESDPPAAKEAISTVRSTAKSALEEMRAMIGVLRSGEAAETEPTRGTGFLGELARYLEDAGITCEVRDSLYNRAYVPAFVDVALYGIAREATTNIVRHAQASNARIMLWTDIEGTAGSANLVVRDDGRGGAQSRAARLEGREGDEGAREGHGVEGMAERAHVLRGFFETADLADGGFEVSVSIPFEVKEARS